VSGGATRELVPQQQNSLDLVRRILAGDILISLLIE
jgi:hypothetical protein